MPLTTPQKVGHVIGFALGLDMLTTLYGEGTGDDATPVPVLAVIVVMMVCILALLVRSWAKDSRVHRGLARAVSSKTRAVVLMSPSMPYPGSHAGHIDVTAPSDLTTDPLARSHRAVKTAQKWECEDMGADLERNKGNVKAFCDLVFNECRPREAIERYAGNAYRQHNPHVPDGKDAFIEYFERMAEEYPGKHVEFVRAFAEGDHVILHSHQTWPNSDDYVGIDIFRLDPDGKVVEHWDVLQVVPETSANDNGMF